MKKRKSFMKYSFIILFTFVLAFICLFNFKTNADANTFDFIVTNPGVDCSTQMRFSWHSTAASCVFHITTSNDTEFKDEVTYNVNGVYDDTTFTNDAMEEKISNYKYELNLSDLNPDTKYLYKISTGSNVSDVYSFYTAGQSGVFNFIWASDDHVYTKTSSYERVTYFKKLVSYVEKEIDFNLVIHSGDNVSNGGVYKTWQTSEDLGLYKDNVWASTIGNHEMYITGTSLTGSPRDIFYQAMYNYPDDTGIEDGTYCFLYNSVLFISLDSINASPDSKILAAQKEWFEKIVQANEGKYQYIIVYQHYPWFNALTGSNSGPYGVNRNTWKDLFDKYNVDLALAGDHHFAYRSKKIYNDEIMEDDSELGTVYIGAPQIGSRDRAMTDTKDLEYYNWRSDDTKESDGTSGLTYFEVTTEGITGTLIDLSGKVLDKYTIKSRRNVTWENKKESLCDSYVVASTNESNTLNFNSSCLPYISSIKVQNGTETIANVNVTNETKAVIELPTLEKNKSYTLDVTTNFVDGTIKQTKVYANTYGFYGYVDSFKALGSDDKMNIYWNAQLENNILANYKLSVDGKDVATLKATDTSYSMPINEVNFDSVYTLTLLTENNDILAVYECTHSLFGDSDMNGSVGQSDVTNIMSLIRSNHEFSANEIRLLDQNNDGKVDIADATIIQSFLNKKESNLNCEKFTVTVLGINGEVLSVEEVYFGANATIPSDTGIAYWTSSFNYITKNLVIKGIK